MGIFLTLLLTVANVSAQQTPLATPLNSGEPIQITSDTLEANNRDRTFLFTGHVKVVQGTTEMTSDRLKVWYESDKSASAETTGGASRIRDIEADGNVVIVFDGRTARSDKARYSAATETLTLLGDNATIVDGKNTIRGAKITLYRTEDRITVEGSSKGRVEAVIFPGGKAPNN